VHTAAVESGFSLAVKRTNEDMMTNRMVNGTGAALLALSGAAKAAYEWNLPTPVTRVATEIYDLHLIMMGIILVIFIGVFGVMFYSIYAHRKSVGHKAEHFHENITVEIIWAIIPFLILIAVAWPATRSILNLKDTASPDITIKATGYQWWQPESRGNYGELIEPRPLSDPELRLLDGRPFRLSQLRGKWVMLQLDSGACAEGCRKKLLYMRQARLALGKNMDRVERVWLLTDPGAPDAALAREFEFEGTQVARAAGNPVLAEFPAARSSVDHIYIVDPLGNLMLRFPSEPDPGRMMRDLARLLKASRIG